MKNMFPIHIAFCVNDAYVPYISVTLKSIVENHRDDDVTIHLLTDYISERKRLLLNDVVSGASNIKLCIYIVDDVDLRGLKDTWSIYTWYRVLLPRYLSKDTHRVLYLDADTIVDSNLRDLFSLEMDDDKSIAAVVDPESFNDETFRRCGYDKGKKYVCAGVMLMNLDYWRKHNLSNRIIEWGREHNDIIKFPDQDTINYLCRDSKIILPLRYGIMDYFFRVDLFYGNEYIKELYDCIEHPAIIHYAGQTPWKKELAKTVMQDRWTYYNKMLRHPVKQVYITKGWNLIKMHIWNFFHPCSKKRFLTRSEVLNKMRCSA